jgi:hypothetical protein
VFLLADATAVLLAALIRIIRHSKIPPLAETPERRRKLLHSMLNAKCSMLSQCPIASRYFSTSIAAMQPVPEAVIACR